MSKSYQQLRKNQDKMVHASSREIEDIYEYKDEKGKVLFEIVRYKNHDFKGRHKPLGSNDYIWSLKGIKKVLYRLPELLAADPNAWVFICEGEKDVKSVVNIGLTATTNPFGAGKWSKDYSKTLRGRRVAITPDNDEPGREHAEKVVRSLIGIAAEVRIIALPGLPEKGDITDWISNGGNKEKLLGLVEAADNYVPEKRSTKGSQGNDRQEVCAIFDVGTETLDKPPTIDEVEEVIMRNFSHSAVVWKATDACMSVYGSLLLEDISHPVGLNLQDVASSEKTTVLDFFRESEITYQTDSFTPRSFVSHAANVSRNELDSIDLLPRIRHKVVVIPELAPLFGEKKEDLLKNMAVLTRIFDGKGYRCDSGIRGRRGYWGDYLFGWLGATTPLPDQVWAIMGRLGSRFLFLCMDSPQLTIEQRDLILTARDAYDEKVKECALYATSYLLNLFREVGGVRKIPWKKGGDSKKLRSKILNISETLRHLRGIVSSGILANEELDAVVPQVEGPFRIDSLLYDIARGHAIIHGRRQINDDDVTLAIEIALSSMPVTRRVMFLNLLHFGTMDVGDVSRCLGVTEPTARKKMRVLAKLGAVSIKEDFDYSANTTKVRISLLPRDKWLAPFAKRLNLSDITEETDVQ